MEPTEQSLADVESCLSQPAKRRSRAQLSDEAAGYVRELIMTGQLRHPTFVRLDRIAEELDMSVTPVREGMLVLRGEGFLTLEPRRGFVVAPLRPDDIQALFWVQAQLAGELVARAASRLGAEGVDHLHAVQDQLVNALREERWDAVEELNHEFHRYINLAADAPKIAWFLRLASRYVPKRFYHEIGGWPAASVHGHAAILAAVSAQDPDVARVAMMEHIRNSGALLAMHHE